MFTLKFHKYITESDQQIEMVVSAKSYEKMTYGENGFGFLVDGVEYRVSPRASECSDYSVCYVENLSGKTIDRASSSQSESLSSRQ